MGKISLKKLTLSRQTIRDLTSQDMEGVVGGAKPLSAGFGRTCSATTLDM